jgi:hypothetical protein
MNSLQDVLLFIVLATMGKLIILDDNLAKKKSLVKLTDLDDGVVDDDDVGFKRALLKKRAAEGMDMTDSGGGCR